MLAPHPHGNRQQRRADAAWRRLTFRRSVSVLRLADGLARVAAPHPAGQGIRTIHVRHGAGIDKAWNRSSRLTRNEARRRLQAEVTRRYGKHHAAIMGARLPADTERSWALAYPPTPITNGRPSRDRA